MISRKRIYIKYIVIIIFLLGFTAFLFGVKIIQNRWNIIPNYGFSDEQIKEYGEFWISIPAAENKGLQSDVNAVTFEDEKDTIYFVLPSSLDISKVVYYVRDGYQSEYEARRVANFSNGYDTIAGKTIKLIKSDIPVMYIETGNNSASFYDFKESYDRDIICNSRVCLTYSSESGIPLYYESEKWNADKVYDKAYLKPRGNQTWAGMHKKPYTLVLDSPENLLNMGKFSKWNLLADSQDKSLLKNYIFNRLAHEMGVEYEPNMEHILLYVNGSLQGIYLLTTKIGVGKSKVNIGKDDFLFVWGGSHPEQIIPYDSKSWFCDTDDINYPYVDLIYPKNDSDKGLLEKKEIIQRYINSIEKDDSDDFMQYLDMDSIVKYYWIEEISMNTDACYRSTYTYYKKSTGKLYFGPVWDMDLTLGSNATKDGIDFLEPEGWKVRNIGYFKALFEHSEFKQNIEKAYWNDGIREKLYNVIDEYKNEKKRIYGLAVINNKIWKDENIESALYYEPVSYDVNVDKTLEFYINRLSWIDNEMKNEDDE